MCEYCMGMKVIKDGHSEATIDSTYPATLEIDTEGLHERIRTEITINYCPFCGRKFLRKEKL
jgi:hypothetical protein